MHRHTKFQQNRWNGCRDIAFNVFRNAGHPPSWIIYIYFLNIPYGRGPVCISVQNFIQIVQTIAEM